MDVQRMSFWDIAITIRYLLSVIQRMSRGCISVMYMCKILRTKWKYFKIPYGSKKYFLLFHYYIMKMNYFK